MALHGMKCNDIRLIRSDGVNCANMIHIYYTCETNVMNETNETQCMNKMDGINMRYTCCAKGIAMIALSGIHELRELTGMNDCLK